MARQKRVAALMLAIALIAAACGGDSQDSSEEEATNGTSGESSAPDPDGLWWENIEGGALEIGVLPAEGTPALEFMEDLKAEMEADIEGTDATFTFANTLVRPAIEQRWRGGNALDVDYWMFDGTNANLLNWADDGYLLDLRPYLEQEHPKTGEPWIDQFAPAALNFMTHPENDGIYAVPSELTNIVLFYNAGMFEDLDITPPTTWDEFLDAGEALKAADIDPVAVSGLIDFYLNMWPEHLWMRTVGYEQVLGTLTRGEGTVLEHPGYLEGLEMLEDIINRDFFLKGFEGGDFTAVQAQFFQGDTGMILMGSWLISEMAEVIPDDFNVGVLPFPEVPGADGDQTAVMSASNQMVVSAESDNIPLALEWIRRLTDPDVQAARAEQLGQTSAITGVPGPARMDALPDIIGNASALVSRHYGLLEIEAKDVVMPEIERLFFGVQDAEETLERIADGLDRLYS